MAQTKALSPTPAATQTPPQPAPASRWTPSQTNWPIPGDAVDLLSIVQAQAATMADQAALIDAYQSALSAAQTSQPTAATGAGTAVGNQLTMTGVTGSIVVGAVIGGGGALVPAGTTIMGQISGTSGSTGVYLTSNPTTASGTALTFTPPPVATNWPTPQDAPTLNLLSQQQTAAIRTQNALLQHYQDVLNTSQTVAPPSGP